MRRRLFRLPRRDAAQVLGDVDEELRFHLDMRARELEAGGLDPDDARAESRRQFGDLEYTRRYCRDLERAKERSMRRTEYLDELIQDVRYAARTLRRSGGFAAVAVLTLALGIGANAAIFSVVNGVLLRPLPFEQADRLVRVMSQSKGQRRSVSPRDYLDWQARSRSFAAMGAWFESTVNLTGEGEPERFTQARVSANLFAMLGVRPTLGRTFAAGEDVESAPRVAILSDRLWRRRFAADPAVVGRAVLLDGYPTEIVGVAPPYMRYPLDVDLWLTTRFSENDVAESSRGARWISVVARLAPDATLAQAQDEMRTIARELEAHDPRHNTGIGAEVALLRDQLVGQIRTPLLLLLGAVGFVMLIACANVASLSLGRTAARGTELAVRAALGAGRARLVRQLLTESIVLSVLGGAVGLLLAVFGTRALVSVTPSDIPRLNEVRVDAAVLAFGLGVTLLAGLLFGLVPSLHASASKLQLRLREGSRGTRSHAGSSRARGALVVTEMALAIVLLTGAGLLLRSFAKLRDVDPGFRTSGVSTFSVTLSPTKYPRLDQQRAFAQGLLDRAKRLPGFESVGITFGLPLSYSSYSLSFDIAGRPPAPPDREPVAQIRVASPGYFATLGIPVVRGRGLSDQDRQGSPPVVVISREAARRWWPNENPIGQRITAGWRRDSVRFGGEIVGIVGDVKQFGLDASTTPHVYAPFDQWPLDELTVVVRSRANPGDVAVAARAAVLGMDPDLPMYDVRTLDGMVADSLGHQRFYLLLLALFAASAIALAAVGIYGVMAYAVQQRTREIGVRIALGATARHVRRMIVGQGLALAFLGAAIGIAGALVVTRVMSSLLYGVSPTDPFTLVSGGALLVVVAALASYLPARRAATLDPVVAMRSE